MTLSLSLPDGPLMERPQSYEEMRQRGAFQTPLDDRKHELRQVLSDYRFSHLVPCGRKSCRRAHYDGFLVETENGIETNIGHVCGRKLFGDRFDIERQKHQRKREREDLLKRAATIKAIGEDIERRIAGLNQAQYGIRWVKNLRTQIRDLIGDGLYQSLQLAHKRQDLDVIESKERSATAIQRLAERTGQPREKLRYEHRTIGRLQPMSWATFDFTEKLRDEILVPLREFCELDHRALPQPKLKKAVRQFDNWEKTVEEAAEATNSALRFLEADNLKLLVLWIPEGMARDRTAVAQWIGSQPYRALLAGLNPA